MASKEAALECVKLQSVDDDSSVSLKVAEKLFTVLRLKISSARADIHELIPAPTDFDHIEKLLNSFEA